MVTMAVTKPATTPTTSTAHANVMRIKPFFIAALRGPEAAALAAVRPHQVCVAALPVVAVDPAALDHVRRCALEDQTAVPELRHLRRGTGRRRTPW
jgi:hypothetical protein